VSLRRLLVFVSLALIVETSAYAAIGPLLPGLSETHGLDKGEAGLVTGAYPAGTLLLSLPAAWLVSRAGARATVIAGLATLAVASLCFGLAGSAILLAAARFGQGAGAAAVWAGALAWVVAVAPRERRAEAIGTAVGAAIAGGLAGPVLGAAADGIGIGIVFGAYVALPVAMIVWASRLEGSTSIPGMSPAAVRAAFGDPRMRRGMWLMALPAVAFGLINVLVPLRLDELGAGAAVIALVFLAAIGLEALMSPFVGRLADRRGRIWPARVGLASGGVALALVPLPHTIVLLALAAMVAAPLLGMLWAPALAMLSDAAEARGLDSALGFGLANLAWGIGAMTGTSGGGALAGASVDAVPYLLVAGVALVTAWSLGRQNEPVPAL